MHKLNGRSTKVYGQRRVKSEIKPLTVINVKPYTVITQRGKILCGGPEELPLVFDTKELAIGFVEEHGLGPCRLKTLQLEDLARKCRDRRVHFSKFYLLDDESQLY